MRRLIRYLLAICVDSSAAHAAAQRTASPNGGTSPSAWFSYFGDQPVSDHWAVHLEGSYRRTLDLSQFEQVELRPGLSLSESDAN